MKKTGFSEEFVLKYRFMHAKTLCGNVSTFDLSMISTSDKAQLDSLCENVNLENDIPKNL